MSVETAVRRLFPILTILFGFSCFAVCGCTEDQPERSPSKASPSAPDLDPSSATEKTISKPVKTAPEPQIPTTLFVRKKPGSLSVLEGIEMGAPVSSLAAISPRLAKGKPWTVPDAAGVTIQAYLTPQTKTLRYLSIGLPKGSLKIIESAWGTGRRAQLNGRRNGLFWFDEARGLQASMADHPQSTRMTIGPFVPLERILAPSNEGKSQTPAQFIGAPADEVRASFDRTMDRPQGTGFIAWMGPVRYHTHPIGLRMVVEKSQVVSISFPLSGMGQGGSLTYLVELIETLWGKPEKVETAAKEDQPYRWTWRGQGHTLSILKNSASRSRPPRQRVMVSLTAEGYAQPVKAPSP